MAGCCYKAVVFVDADEKRTGAHGLGQRSYLGNCLLSHDGAGYYAISLVAEEVGISVLGPGGFFPRHGVPTDEVNRLGKKLVGPVQNLSL